jgi:Uncharacterized protein conserved in bacteria
MNCEELREDYELHALGLLDQPERAELEAHLARGCAACSQGMKRAMAMNAAIYAITPEVEVPKRLRKKVLAAVGVEQTNWMSISGWTVALATVLIAMFWVRVPDPARQALSLLNEPETKQVVFGEGQPKPPRGRVFIHATRGVLLLASNLPQAEAGKTYELWVIPKGGAPKPAGLFQSDKSGNALYLSSGPVDVNQTGAVAVTLEPEAGSPAPTSTPIIVAAL